ncbi:MAG: hypothetical protein IPM34_04155 [Saprospiraceae bacterium]|nr:hypothetical protein [Saprospiraceae bacterium]
MKTKIATLIALMVLIFQAGISQGWKDKHRDWKDDDFFDDRIEEGWRHGKLTRDERRLLELQEERILEVRRWMLRDGHLDRWESKKLQKMYRDFNRELRKQKEDRDRRHRGHR